MISALYALIAIGFTLIFGVGGVLNLAHGATITMGAFSAYYAGQLGLGIPAAVLASVAIPALFAGALYLGMVKRLEDEPIMVMITTLVVSVVIEQAIMVFEGTTSRSLPRSRYCDRRASRASSNVATRMGEAWSRTVGSRTNSGTTDSSAAAARARPRLSSGRRSRRCQKTFTVTVGTREPKAWGWRRRGRRARVLEGTSITGHDSHD
jgi:branched-subunit amino acid ABC-type transport system permease component